MHTKTDLVMSVMVKVVAPIISQEIRAECSFHLTQLPSPWYFFFYHTKKSICVTHTMWICCETVFFVVLFALFFSFTCLGVLVDVSGPPAVSSNSSLPSTGVEAGSLWPWQEARFPRYWNQSLVKFPWNQSRSDAVAPMPCPSWKLCKMSSNSCLENSDIESYHSTLVRK